jgi:hypothetical protein
MSDPADAITAAIYSAFDSYPKEGDPDYRRIANADQLLTRAGALRKNSPLGKSVSSPDAKNFASPFGRNSFMDSNRPTPPEGRIAIVTDAGCVGLK